MEVGVEVAVKQTAWKQGRVEVQQGGAGLTQVGQQIGHLFIHLAGRERR